MEKYVNYKGEIRQVIDTPIGHLLSGKIHLPEWETECRVKFPKIPYGLFMQVCRWQQEIVDEHSCECATSLFLVDDKWVAVPFYQTNTKSKMTIDVDFTEERNAPILNEMMDKSVFHATIHNHVKSGAFQSGTDSNDEKGLYGPHITIGHLDKRKLDFHGRLSMMVGGKHYFIPLRFSDIIDITPPPGVTAEELTKLEECYLTFNRHDAPDYPEEWKDRFEIRTYTPAQNVGFSYWGDTPKKNATSATGASGSSGTVVAGTTSKISHISGQKAWVDSILTKIPKTSLMTFCNALTGLPNVQKEAIFQEYPGKTYKDIFHMLLDRKIVATTLIPIGR